MKIRLKQTILNEKHLASIAGFIILFFLLFLPSSTNAGESSEHLAQCAKIKDDAARLQCFDDLAGKKITMPETAATINLAKPVAQKISSAPDKLSVMTQQWDLDKEHRKHTLVLRPYRPIYFLPVAYNASPNEESALSFDSETKAQHNEAKFQLSFKVKAWQDLGDKDIDLWFAYTQLSFWQLYNSAFSSPFRDNNYEPELLINFRTNYELFGFKGRFVNVGFNHQSNGRSLPLSRSWNRVVANLGWEKDNLGLLLKTWYRIPERESNDDNPDISRYMGCGELWGTYHWERHKFAVMFRNNLRPENNFGAVQLDWSFPLPLFKGDKFKGYIQYFNGYGESLLDYNKSINRISAGFMLTDWQ